MSAYLIAVAGKIKPKYFINQCNYLNVKS
ncbi:rCG36225 [Rattus norvegicus]|uniref:RCG36225 n=1 Tax=Rattus norvegicus TaxID=10116 RepID=A6IPL6_RAT|nr:rCG36225 [Rattus norvegicus]